ncbi:MAG: MBL fold metallo-hydrolase [Candidatus Hodarchaeota archaeon]
MSKEETTPDLIKDIYNLPLGEKEAAFIYSGWARILFRTKEKTIAFDIGAKGITTEGLNFIKHLDLHLYSHTHRDHFSPRVTKKLFKQTNAPLIVEPMVTEEIPEEIPSESIQVLSTGETKQISGFEIRSTVGIHPRPITLFCFKWDKISIFHGADSGHVNLSRLKAEFAFIPTGRPSPSCSPEEGLKMVMDVQSQVAVAMHGTTKQMQEFKHLVEKNMPECSVIIPEKGKITKILI